MRAEPHPRTRPRGAREALTLTTRAIEAPSHGRRAFAAGTGVTGALVAAAVVAFVSVAAFVAFSGGLPFVGSGSGTQHVVLRASNPAAAAAANAGAPATAAVAAVPAAPIPAGAPGAPLATTPTGAQSPTGNPGSPTRADRRRRPAHRRDGVEPADLPGRGADRGRAGHDRERRGQHGRQPRAEHQSLGSDPGHHEPLDNTTRGLLNNVGGTLGDPHLGDNTTTAVNGLTGGLLGGG